MSYLIGHFIGDILLQNRWLARQKMRTPFGMVLHVIVAGSFPALLSGWTILQWGLSVASHFVIDWFRLGKRYPDLVGQGNPANKEPAPMWLGLMADQIFHLVCLYAISFI